MTINEVISYVRQTAPGGDVVFALAENRKTMAEQVVDFLEQLQQKQIANQEVIGQ
jgi:hypothetical protein